MNHQACTMFFLMLIACLMFRDGSAARVLAKKARECPDQVDCGLCAVSGNKCMGFAFGYNGPLPWHCITSMCENKCEAKTNKRGAAKCVESANSRKKPVPEKKPVAARQYKNIGKGACAYYPGRRQDSLTPTRGGSVYRAKQCQKVCDRHEDCTAFAYKNGACWWYRGGPYTHTVPATAYNCYALVNDDTAAPKRTYVAGPGVSNLAWSEPYCVGTWYGSLEQAKDVCDADKRCTVLHDYNCDGRNWRYCISDLNTVKRAGQDTKSCTMVVAP